MSIRGGKATEKTVISKGESPRFDTRNGGRDIRTTKWIQEAESPNTERNLIQAVISSRIWSRTLITQEPRD